MHPLCWFLGHSLGERTIEERRETRSHGRVLLIREYKSCRRCGAEVDLFTNSGLIAPAGPGNGQDEDADVHVPDRDGPMASNAVTADPPGYPRAGPDPEQEESTTEPAIPSRPTEQSRSSAVTAQPSSTSTEPPEPGPAESDTEAGVEIIPSIDADPQHRCPECGFEVVAASSPYMAGDICSNCHQGYIEPIDSKDGRDRTDRFAHSSEWVS